MYISLTIYNKWLSMSIKINLYIMKMIVFYLYGALNLIAGIGYLS